MFNRLKRVLVESYIGAIALGYLLAQAILYFVNIFPAVAAAWVAQNMYRLPLSTTEFAELRIEAPVREAVGFIVLSLIWYALLRWLYFTPLKQENAGPSASGN